MNPKDLWSNTDMLYRQMEQTKVKERRKVRQTNIMTLRSQNEDN